MNDDLQRLMTEAAHLTRNGQLGAATEAIQRALLGGGFGDLGKAGSAAPAEGTWPGSVMADGAGLILDGLTRFIDTPDDDDLATVDPMPPQAPGRPSAKAKADRQQPSQEPLARGPHPEQWIDGSFTHQRRTLAYKLFVPALAAGATPGPRPLVVMLHGCTQSAADFAAGTQMNELARNEGVIVLYPEQTQHANAQRCWNWFKPQHQQRGRGEPALLVALTQSITAQYQVDPRRVYVAGLSAGGAMADILGRCYPDVFAAVGVHSGLPRGAANDVMSAMTVMRSGEARTTKGAAGDVAPTIVFHGDADSTVHSNHGEIIVERAREGRSSLPPPVTTEGRSPSGQGFTRTVYPSDVRHRHQAEHWRLHRGGHAWSGGSTKGSYTDPRGVDASAEMLRFFLAHGRG